MALLLKETFIRRTSTYLNISKGLRNFSNVKQCIFISIGTMVTDEPFLVEKHVFRSKSNGFIDEYPLRVFYIFSLGCSSTRYTVQRHDLNPRLLQTTKIHEIPNLRKVSNFYISFIRRNSICCSYYFPVSCFAITLAFM